MSIVCDSLFCLGIILVVRILKVPKNGVQLLATVVKLCAGNFLPIHVINLLRNVKAGCHIRYTYLMK